MHNDNNTNSGKCSKYFANVSNRFFVCSPNRLMSDRKQISCHSYIGLGLISTLVSELATRQPTRKKNARTVVFLHWKFQSNRALAACVYAFYPLTMSLHQRQFRWLLSTCKWPSINNAFWGNCDARMSNVLHNYATRSRVGSLFPVHCD